MATIKIDDDVKQKIEFEAKLKNKSIKEMSSEMIEFYFKAQELDFESINELTLRFNKLDAHLLNIVKFLKSGHGI